MVNNINRTSLLNDYLFICFLIGNDFIINSHSINIRYNGLEILLSIYKNIQKDLTGEDLINSWLRFAINKVKLNIDTKCNNPLKGSTQNP